VQAGRAQLVAIDVGDSNGLESQILEGLEEGDLVILHPSSDIEDGLRVTPIQ
jgi:HlyD family secretion protein